MEEIPAGEDSTLSHMDNALVFGNTQQEHDQQLKEVLEMIQKEGVTINKVKCAFNRDNIRFLGHITDKYRGYFLTHRDLNNVNF